MGEKVKVGFEGTVFYIRVDMNLDDVPLAEVKINLAQIPGEIFDLIFKKPAPKA
jgi:hypothetical protein